MKTSWPKLKPRLVAALADRFNEGEFTRMIEFACQKKLADLTADRIPFPQKVYEVVGDAEEGGWLERLVRGASESNEAHLGLRAVAADFRAGFEAEEQLFYQQHLIAEAAGITEEAVLLRQLHPYLKTVQNRTSSVPLTGLDESGEQGKELALAEMFVPLNLSQIDVDLWELGDKKGAMADAIGHVHNEPRLILLGDPGSGKSTLMRYLAYCLAGAVQHPSNSRWQTQLSWPVIERDNSERERDKDKIEQTHHWTDAVPVPIFIVLRDFARHTFDPNDGTAIVDYVCRQLEPDDLGDCDAPLRQMARRGQVLFLLDGVDEIPVDERPDVWKAISALDKGVYGGNRWVATCRVLSFDRREAPANAPVQTLQPLNETQINQFIDNWYAGHLERGEDGREQLALKATALKGAVQRPALQELAQNPMLLTIMALVQTFRGTLPDDRAKLYQACVETLLLRWQLRVETGGDELPDTLRALGTTVEDLERLLWAIAWEAHRKAEDRSSSADIPKWDVIQIAEEHLGSLGKAEKFLEYTEQRAHLLVGRGGRREQVYSFPHRTFQEYLAACHLASQRRFSRRAKELATESDTWREVLNLAVGTLAFNQNNREKAVDAVAEMMPRRQPETDDADGWRRVWLAGEMCATIGRQATARDEVGAYLLPKLRDMLVALLEAGALTPQQRAEAGDALGRLGDLRPGVCTLEPDLIEIPAGDFLYGDDKETRTIKKAFAIARYPVTVAQFGMFVQDGGYEEARYWGGTKSAAWKWRESEHPDYRGEEAITQPQFWLQPRWHGENRPIVGVSWYEAQAYCAWLTEKSEDGREYRLPTEEEWERAARHTNGRQWAWGDEWENGVINSKEAQISRTTTVGAFPRGVAKCGAHDMSGNVEEWTLEQGVRGGSWFSHQFSTHVAFRSRYYPHDSYDAIGFRLASPVF